MREGRIQSDDYPRDWQYDTLTYPVAEYKNLTWAQLGEEVTRFNDRFYSYPRILRRLLQLASNTHNPGTLLVVLVANLSGRYNYLRERRICASRVHSLKPGRAAASAARRNGRDRLAGKGSRCARDPASAWTPCPTNARAYW